MFGSKQRLDMGVIQLNEFLKDSENLFRSTLGENIHFSMNRADNLSPIEGDLTQVGQVVMNLVSNAREAMPRGGNLQLSTSNCSFTQPQFFSHLNVPAGSYVLLRVEDSGTGIKPEFLDRIFDPFFTTKDATTNSGLGLSAVYGIVDKLRGGIHVESKENQGSVFSIYFPIGKKASTPSADSSSLAGAGDMRGTETVLLVEDDTALRGLLVRHLEGFGYKVLVAPHGGAALEKAKEHEPPIDLILTDVIMPVLDGPSLVKELKRIRNDFVVLYISGYTRDKLTNLDIGERSTILYKPFTREQLACTLRKVLDERV